ncbi:phospholipase D family protein [Rhizobium leguminosarum]|uniref:phospholipase D family protein n=1 Tax=Rhizobium leguminosarum TaxID=384 RepID=UPI001C976D27|nr:phospholipase D family protein [Rhizobium leguminosarum]MBY5439344.1 hypothetical protein [Rhizobium leguminosarum]
MSDRKAWLGQPYLDELRPDHLETVRLALFATYSVDLSAVAATLLALIGRNNDEGSGTAVDFAQAIDKLRGKVTIVIQRGHIARPKALPRIAGILDQFVVEQHHDEESRSWHPKIALIAYDCPGDRVRWKLWIGSRNLTRSRDLDAGVLLDGSPKRAKGRVRLPGVGAMGASLARDAHRSDSAALAAELESLWWEAPAGFAVRALLNGLDEGVALPAGPPAGLIESITVISPFLSADFVKAAGKWGPDDARTLISSMPALVDMANRAGKPLSGFSKILAYAAPDVLFEEEAADLPGSDPVTEDDEEPVPLALHAKVYCFDMGEQTILRVGSANATSRAWSGRNSEIMVELAAGEEFRRGVDFLVGKATPVTLEELRAIAPSDMSSADALEASRKRLMTSWDPVLLRDGDLFSIDAQQIPQLADASHRLQVGHANGDLLAWPREGTVLKLGVVTLPHQSAFIQICIAGPDRDLRWMQRVEVRPPLEPERDLAALASHMGLRAFHDWMRAMLNGDTLPVDGTLWDEDPGKSPKRRDGRSFDRLTLEDILSAWARDRKAFGRVDRYFALYVDALLTHGDNLSEAERLDLNELAQIWAIARARLAS